MVKENNGQDKPAMDPQKQYNRFLEVRKHFLINHDLT